MADRYAKKLENAVASLSRVRAAESDFDKDGVKTVWHQGAKGADLLSYVDTKGHVVRQELTLIAEHFRWTSKNGIRTGFVKEEGGAQTAKASAVVSLDDHVEADRIRRAHYALLTYAGEDKYILHIKRVIGFANAGLEEKNESTVTRSLPSLTPGPMPAVEPPSKGLPMWGWVVVGLVVGGGAAAFALLR